MFDNQHKIKAAKNYDDMFTYIFIQEYTITKHSYIITNTVVCLLTKKNLYLYLKFCRVILPNLLAL